MRRQLATTAAPLRCRAAGRRTTDSAPVAINRSTVSVEHDKYAAAPPRSSSRGTTSGRFVIAMAPPGRVTLDVVTLK
jgi:hypothetical protein